MNIENNEYRVGDIICGFMNSSFAKENSIGKLYKEQTNNVNDYYTLNNILKNKYNDYNNFPSENDLVIHIRLGDVIEYSPYSVQEYWDSEEELKPIGDYLPPTVYYIKNKYYYIKILEIIKKKNININNIILVTFFHRTSTNEKSIEFLNKIKDLFKEYNIIERINKDIDEDLVFMSKSKYFCFSSGGFSYVISKIIELNGGYIFSNYFLNAHCGIYNGIWINSNSVKYYNDINTINFIHSFINNINVRGVWVPYIDHKTIMPILNFYIIDYSKETNIFYYDIKIFKFKLFITKLYNEYFNEEFNLYEIHNYFNRKTIQYQEKNIEFEGKNIEFEKKNIEFEGKNIEFEEKNIEFEEKNIEFEGKNIESEEKNIEFEEKNIEFEEKNIEFEEKNIEFEEKNIEFEEKNIEFEEKNIEFEEKNIEFEEKNIEFELIKIFHNYFDENNDFKNIYELLIKDFICKLFPNENYIMYQKKPDIKFHMPNKLNFNENTDIINYSFYNEIELKENELIVILPLTMMFESNSIYFKKKSNNLYESLFLDSNCISLLYSDKFYNKINKTNYSRVNIYFRIIAGSLYKEEVNSDIDLNNYYKKININ